MNVPASERPAPPSAGCIDEDTLCAFADGQLAGEEAARVEEHLADCPACGQLVAHVMASTGVRPISDRPGSARSARPAGVANVLAPGTQVARYVVEEPVGAGAMSTVYAAHDPELDRRVALKLLRPGPDGGDLRSRLYREAKAMARLAHPNVITVYDVGVYGAQLFVAMELVRGSTLRGWLAATPRAWRDVVARFAQAGRGLACAHTAGLVHRDFKPDNVLVGDDGRVRVTDFGLARATTFDDDAPIPSSIGTDLVTTITQTGALVGTPAYMAPEQLRGEPTDARADMFGFCVALYEALYHERPFAGHDVRGLRSATSTGVMPPPPAGSTVPAKVRDALLPGLRPRPEDRYATMEALLDALEGAVVATDAPRPRVAAPEPRRRGAARVWATVGMLGVGIAAAGAVGARAVLRARGAPPATELPQPARVEPPVVAREVVPPPPATILVPAASASALPRPAFTSRPAPPATRSAAPQAPAQPPVVATPASTSSPSAARPASSLGGSATYDRE